MKLDLVVCGSTKHVLSGCRERHILAREGDECPVCRKKTRDTWRATKAMEEKLNRQNKTLSASA